MSDDFEDPPAGDEGDWGGLHDADDPPDFVNPLDALARPPQVREPGSDDRSGEPEASSIDEASTRLPDGDDVELSHERGCGRRVVLALLATLVVVLVAAVGGFLWLRGQLDPGGTPGKAVEIEVPTGSSTSQIGSLLEARGIVPNATVFKWWVSWKGKGPFQAGRYRMNLHSSVADAVGVLDQGPMAPPVVKVSIPEGFRVSQILERIHERVPRFSVAEMQSLLDSAAITSTSLPAGTHDYEGLLFPATYEVTEDETAQDLLQQMAAAMDERVSTADFQAGAAALNLTPYELLTAASLIQAEAGNPDEAPKIARVIYNRMRTHEPLGIDATSRYLSILTGDPVDFESTSPYNTRRVAGLPPTPIAAPGDFAINAALHPADGPWTWYVRDVNDDPQGRPQHVFTDSAAEFERAKAACKAAGLGCG